MLKSKEGQPLLSIVIPCYNEERRLPGTIQEIRNFFGTGGASAEVIVVDDGSSDDTFMCARRTLGNLRGCVLAMGTNRGKGDAFRHGFLHASGRFVLLCDADMSTPISEITRFLDLMQRDSLDIIIGSRRLEPASVTRRQVLHRRVMGLAFSAFQRAVCGLSFHDTQCGFKLMRRTALLPVVRKLKVPRFAFDVELLYVATRHGLRIRELPVEWADSTGSRVNPLLDPIMMVFDLARIRAMHRQEDNRTAARRRGARAQAAADGAVR